MVICNFFWGSHGCSFEAGDHDGLHQCGTRWETYFDSDYDAWVPADICCQYDEGADSGHRVRWVEDGNTWGEWGPYGEGWYQKPFKPPQPRKMASGGLIKSDGTIPTLYPIDNSYIIPYSRIKAEYWSEKIKEWKANYEKMKEENES